MSKIHKGLLDNFARNIAKEREDREMSQRAFARLIGVSHTLVQFWETRAKDPSLAIVEVVAKKLGKKSIDLLK